MRYFILSICVTLTSFFAANMIQAIELDPALLYPNSGGRCLWACLDTLARQHRILKMIGVTRARYEANPTSNTDPGYEAELTKELKNRELQLGDEYARQILDNKNATILECYGDTIGVTVSLHANDYYNVAHAVVVCKYNSKTVEFYDSNRLTSKQPKVTLTCGRDWFDKYWQGSATAFFPKEVDHEHPVSTHASSANPDNIAAAEPDNRSAVMQGRTESSPASGTTPSQLLRRSAISVQVP